MRPYDYAHRSGVEEISWPRFTALCRALAERVMESPFDLLIGNARAGLFPASMLASMLRREMYPVRLTRRENDQVVIHQPVWKVDVPPAVTGREVVVIDEIADTGETLETIRDKCLELGARGVRTVSLVAHSWADPQPDAVALSSDALVIFPWDRYVLQDGEWKQNPEITDALANQSKNSPNG
jgi:hypoxanthine phosphoribosyltransferase